MRDINLQIAAERSTGRNPGATSITTGKGGMPMKPFRVTREYFISDADLARFLGLSTEAGAASLSRWAVPGTQLGAWGPPARSPWGRAGHGPACAWLRVSVPHLEIRGRDGKAMARTQQPHRASNAPRAPLNTLGASGPTRSQKLAGP